MLNSLVIAFAMYSKIPMPKAEWNEKNMRYSLCFFPWIGAVTGLCELCCFYALRHLFGEGLVRAALMTAVPLLVSGGIHMDGFLDTVDAKSSWKTREERLMILKDPHTGAFAVIYGVLYLLVTFALYHEISEKALPLMAVGYVFERVLSGLSVTVLKKAKRDGTASAFAEASGKKVKWVLAGEGALCMAAFLLLNPLAGALCILTGAVCFIYYRGMAYRHFGGITGDLAGWFLQLTELLLLLVLVLAQKRGYV